VPITAEEKIKLVRLKIFQNYLRTDRTAILTPGSDNGHCLLRFPARRELFYIMSKTIAWKYPWKNGAILKGHHGGISPRDPVTPRASL